MMGVVNHYDLITLFFFFTLTPLPLVGSKSVFASFTLSLFFKIRPYIYQPVTATKLAH